MLERRGIVLTPADLHEHWPAWLQQAGLNVLGLHGNIDEIIRFVQSAAGRSFLAQLEQAGIAVEYEIHALSYLLPRAEFGRHPQWFRADEQGERTPDVNLCPSSVEALAVAAENAARLARVLAPTTNRYYLWADDAPSWCQCRRCRELGPADQNLLVMNALLAGVQQADSRAVLACLAYDNTLDPPQQVSPAPALFLEFAPIRRRYDRPLAAADVPENRAHLAQLERLLAFFGAERAQVLEYWLDASRFSHWRRPAVQVPFNRAVLTADAQLYRQLGIRSITTFGVYLDAEYLARYGVPPVADYGTVLAADE